MRFPIRDPRELAVGLANRRREQFMFQGRKPCQRETLCQCPVCVNARSVRVLRDESAAELRQGTGDGAPLSTGGQS